MEAFNLMHAKALYLRFSIIYGEKFVKSYHDEDFKSLWFSEWTLGLEGIDVLLIKGSLEYCKLNLEWPPSIAEFRRICEGHAGVPSASEALAAAIRKDFSHPIIALASEKVGSWSMKNDKESVLHAKFQSAYVEALNEFRVNPNKTWLQLKEFNKRLALPEPPSKIPSREECIAFKDRLKQYQEMSNAAKMNLEVKDHPVWPKDKTTIGHKYFDAQVFNERKRYLLSLDEYVAGTLPVSDWYDRTRYMGEIEAMERLKSNPPRVDTPKKEKSSYGGFKASKHAYKDWIN